MSFENNIREWIKLDNEIKELNAQIKNLRVEKEEYNTQILTHIEENNLANAIIKIGDGKLKFVDTKYPQPLTYKFICECLCDYFKDDDEAVMEILCFIKNKRNIKTNKEIKRYNTN